MYARSTEFDEAVSKSHVVAFAVELLQDGNVVTSDLLIASGNVEVDYSADIRRRCSLTVLDPDGTLTPNDANDPLSPYGREIRINRGVRYPDGTTEVLPLGTFRIANATPSDNGTEKQIAVTGFDRSRSVARARFETPYTVAAGTNFADAIRALILSRLPSATCEFISTPAVTPLLVFDQGENPWEKAVEMAASFGCDLFFDPLGVCRLVPVGDATTASVVWDYGAGESATITGIENSLDDEPGYNGVVVDGEPPDAAPVHVAVYDSDPLSPTYYLGAYGKVPRFYKSQYITTLEQATAAANAILLRERGGTEQVKFEAVPHPAHEVGDVVRVADEALGIDSSYVLESFSIPLSLATMSATTRKRRTL